MLQKMSWPRIAGDGVEASIGAEDRIPECVVRWPTRAACVVGLRPAVEDLEETAALEGDRSAGPTCQR